MGRRRDSHYLKHVATVPELHQVAKDCAEEAEEASDDATARRLRGIAQVCKDELKRRGQV